MNEINLSILILVFLLLISALLIFIIYKLRSRDSDSKLVDDLQKLVGNNQDMIAKNFGDLEGTVKTKLENFYDKIKDENNRSSESLSNMLNKISSIERTLTGTKSRGIAGEALLGLYLESSIKTGEVNVISVPDIVPMT